MLDVDFKFGAIAGQIELGEGIQDGRQPVVTEYFDKVLVNAQLVLFDVLVLLVPCLTAQDHSEVDHKVGEEHEKEKKANWVGENHAEFKEADESQQESHPWHEDDEGLLEPEIIENIGVVVHVDDHADQSAQPDVENEGQVVSLILVSSTFAQEQTVTVTLEHALVAWETVMRSRRRVELTSRTVTPFGKKNPGQIDRMNGAIGGYGFEHVAHTVEERVNA